MILLYYLLVSMSHVYRKLAHVIENDKAWSIHELIIRSNNCLSTLDYHLALLSPAKKNVTNFLCVPEGCTCHPHDGEIADKRLRAL
jgi:hypothetical protein